MVYMAYYVGPLSDPEHNTTYTNTTRLPYVPTLNLCEHKWIYQYVEERESRSAPEDGQQQEPNAEMTKSNTKELNTTGVT